MLLRTICWLLPEGAWPIAQSNTNIKYSRKTSYLPTYCYCLIALTYLYHLAGAD